MRSSKSFSSRSHSTKYSLRDSVNCPLRENSSRQSFLISKNLPKRHKYSEYSLRQWVECKHEHLVNFLALKENQWVISDQAINYINQGGQDNPIQFIGLLGNEQSIAQFMQSVCDLSSTEKHGAPLQFHYNRQDIGVSMYMLRLYKRNKVAYFLQPHQSKSGNEDTILKIITKVCQNIIIFASKQPNEELKHIADEIDQLKSQQKIYSNFNLFPSGCFQIFQNQIVCSQSTFQLYQNLFSTLTIGSIQQIVSTHQNHRVIQNNYETAFNIIKQIRQFKLTQHKLQKNVMLIEIIIQYSCQKQNSQCIDASSNSIHPIVRKIYNKLLCQAQHSYQQFLNKLNYHSIDKEDRLLESFYEQELKTIRKFQQTKYDQNLHEQYLQKLCDYITNFELKILQNYRCFKVNQSFESPSFCQDSITYTQLNSSEQILKSIEELRQAIVNDDYSDNYIKSQILMLARNASRLHILGYDQKIRIGQIRQEIDYNWSILHQIQLKNQEKLLQPTEQNLNRQKYRNMQQKLINLNDKSIFLQSILTNVTKQSKEINNLLEIKLNQYEQLQALKTKNLIIMECIQSSSNSNANIIQQKILEVKLRSSLVQQQKQLIISSMQNINSN